MASASKNHIKPPGIKAQSVCARMTALYRAAPWTLRLLGTSSVAVTAAVASAENPAERARSLFYIPLRVSRSLACGAACVAGTHPPPLMQCPLSDSRPAQSSHARCADNCHQHCSGTCKNFLSKRWHCGLLLQITSGICRGFLSIALSGERLVIRRTKGKSRLPALIVVAIEFQRVCIHAAYTVHHVVERP